MLDIYDLRNFFSLLIHGVTIGFFVFIVMVMVVVYKQAKTHKILKAIATAVAIIVGIVICLAISFYPTYKKNKARQERYQTAKAIFDKRCQSAGEKIYKTVDDVEGITLLKVPKDLGTNKYNPARDPMWEDATLRNLHSNLSYKMNFLAWEIQDKKYPNERGLPGYSKSMRANELSFRGFSYIDVKQDDGSYSRHTIKPEEEYDKNPLEPLASKTIKTPARYAVDL